jgi:ABC-2 type transport system ATP-binding protein
MSIVSVHNLVKHYQNAHSNALDGMNLEIFKGEVFGVLGPNGAGKTTLFSILSGILPYTKGDVQVCGLSLKSDLETIKYKLGVVPQEIALYPSLSAKDNLLYIGRMYGLSGKELEEKVDYRIQQFGLTEIQDKPVKTYSGGMKRRINLLGGILHEPEVLILDEPTEGMDVQSRAVMMEMLRKLNKEEGMTILYTSHYLEQAEVFCDRVTIINHGKQLIVGKPSELLNAHTELKSLEELFLKLTGNAIVGQ